MILRAVDVGYAYGAGTAYECEALGGVSLEVAVGELALVLGRTGSGKSTLLRLLAGLMEPSTGEVRAGDDPPSARVARGRVGLVFQDPEAQLFADSVIEDVMFAPRNLGRSDDEVRADAGRALRSVGLDPGDFGERSPFALSGGEARRAAIAGVLAMNPRFLLLDEPTAGLDASGRVAVSGAVASARESAGVVVVSHDPEQWLAVTDRVLVLDAGRTVFSGAPDGLLRDVSAFDRAGLRAPEVLRAWSLARDRGLPAGEPTIDPLVLAGRLAPAGRGDR